MPRPLRSSCDRCHSQKLKCPKEPGTRDCTRCLKAGADCSFSPAGPASRRSLATPVYANDVSFERSHFDANLEMEFDWPLDLSNAAITSSSGLLDLPPQRNAEVPPLDTRSKCVRQLTDLAFEIDQLSMTMPATQALVPIMDGFLAGTFDTPDLQGFNQQKALEEHFSLSQRLIDLYPEIYQLLLPRPECAEDDGEISRRQSCAPAEETDYRVPLSCDWEDKVDIFMFNLVASCHSKAIDILKSFIHLGRACIEVVQASPEMADRHVHVPELRVGNFVASARASSSMQMVLLIHLTSLLADNIKHLRAGIEEGTAKESGTDKATQVVLLQCKLLEERTLSAMDCLEQVTNAVKRVGFIK